jgi:NNP family nitrate/nitrite transporter-like MFS transporter
LIAFAWAVTFFIAFTGWFALVPALDYMVEDPSLGITAQIRKNSNIVSVCGTIVLRLCLGPLVEKFGPRRCMAVLLLWGGFFVGLSAAISSPTWLYVIRFMISFVGATFVPCQYWTTMMFGGEVVGSANAFAGGWGNLGGGFSVLFVAALIDGFHLVASTNMSWRYSQLVIAAMMLVMVPVCWWGAEDCPQGKWEDRLYSRPAVTPGAGAAPAKKAVVDPERAKVVTRTLTERLTTAGPSTPLLKNDKYGAWIDWRVWVLFFQYAACFGVELTVTNTMTNYLYQSYTTDGLVPLGNSTFNCGANGGLNAKGAFVPACSTMGKSQAAFIASLFGLTNIFSRASGGVFSDVMNHYFHMRGRLWAQFILLFGEAILLIVFSRLRSVDSSIVVLVFFALFCEAGCGSTYALVPFVRTTNIGVVTALVGAGGNVGAVSLTSLLAFIGKVSTGYLYMGYFVLAAALLTPLLSIRGTAMFWGTNPPLYYKEPSKEDEDVETASEASESMDSRENSLHAGTTSLTKL